MKHSKISLVLAVFLAVGSVAFAAPVESVESSRVAAFQTIDAFLGEQIVTEQLAKLGLTQAEVTAELAKLDDAQIEQIAAQIDLLQAGGTIQGGNPHPSGVFGCLFRPLGRLFQDLYQLIFCWGLLTLD